MKRWVVTCLTALLLGVFTPGVAEVLENAVHLAQEGHLAHAAPDGDQHQHSGPEHGCTGTTHLCSCCVSLPFLASKTPALPLTVDSRELCAANELWLPTDSPSGLDHPPRA